LAICVVFLHPDPSGVALTPEKLQSRLLAAEPSVRITAAIIKRPFGRKGLRLRIPARLIVARIGNAKVVGNMSKHHFWPSHYYRVRSSTAPSTDIRTIRRCATARYCPFYAGHSGEWRSRRLEKTQLRGGRPLGATPNTERPSCQPHFAANRAALEGAQTHGHFRLGHGQLAGSAKKWIFLLLVSLKDSGHRP
jgi:hypothetical protein